MPRNVRPADKRAASWALITYNSHPCSLLEVVLEQGWQGRWGLEAGGQDRD